MNGVLGTLYQEYEYMFPAQGGNKKMVKWYWLDPSYVDKMYIFILTKDDNIILHSNFHHAHK